MDNPPPMTDDLVGQIKASVTYEYMPMKVRRQLSEAAARIEALEAENRSVRVMLADLHAATLTIATPSGSQLDEARDAAAAYFAQPRVAQHLKQENAKS